MLSITQACLKSKELQRLADDTQKSLYFTYTFYLWDLTITEGRDSSVGIAIRYGLDGPGIESRWGRDFPRPSVPVLGPTQLPIQWVPGLSLGVKKRGVALNTHPI
jgi:hypothetical protein